MQIHSCSHEYCCFQTLNRCGVCKPTSLASNDRGHLPEVFGDRYLVPSTGTFKLRSVLELVICSAGYDWDWIHTCAPMLALFKFLVIIFYSAWGPYKYCLKTLEEYQRDQTLLSPCREPVLVEIIVFKPTMLQPVPMIAIWGGNPSVVPQSLKRIWSSS